MSRLSQVYEVITYLLSRAVIHGTATKTSIVVPYTELSEEMNHFNNKEYANMDLVIDVTLRWATEEADYEQSPSEDQTS